jgi:23S rRNA pseudouridine1911/1915/1917 synthase
MTFDDEDELPLLQERLTLPIPPAHYSGHRLDAALALLRPELSRAFLKKLLDRNAVLLNGVPCKPSQKLRGGETVTIEIPQPDPLTAEPEDIPLDVLHEDDDIIVIDKKPGMVAHPSQGHRTGTLVNALLHHYRDSLSGIGGVLRPGIVHRLDKDTSGCLCAAKNDTAHKRLIQMFMERDVEKTYLAITDRPPKPVSGKVEANMGRSTRDRKLHALLLRGGRHSLTYYDTLENYGLLALVRCRLMTGRTHQARVHLASLGSPVLCDKDYGRQETFTEREAESAVHVFRTGAPDPSKRGQGGKILLARQALHAAELAFAHPVTGEKMRFSSPLPADMASVLAPLRAAMATLSG